MLNYVENQMNLMSTLFAAVVAAFVLSCDNYLTDEIVVVAAAVVIAVGSAQNH
jgi:hypothetical protein